MGKPVIEIFQCRNRLYAMRDEQVNHWRPFKILADYFDKLNADERYWR